jgi:3',5'-cyclic AMP phosphodiesterase CpdA
MNIIHLSDVHFGNKESTFVNESIKKPLISLLNEIESPTTLVISGDITFKGSKEGFTEAKNFFDEILQSNNLERKHIIACPGNHDLNAEESNPLTLFNDFIYSLRRDNKFNFRDKSFSSTIIDDVFFLVINSAHHLDHKYGLIDEGVFSYIEDKKTEIDSCTFKVAITHHHFLNQFQDDTSVIRNGYSLLYALDVAKFNLILHGHQHTIQNMPIGHNNMQIESPRSLNFHEKGYNNGLNRYHINGSSIEKISYTFSKDTDPTKLTLKRD